MSTDKGAGTSGAQFAQLLAAIENNRERMDVQLAEMRMEMRQSQDEAAAKAVKRVRRDKAYVYRKKGNEEQAHFNHQVEEVVADATAELTAAGSSPAIGRAQEVLAKGEKLLLERQKIIKIADHSEFGWGVVAEYTADDLADDSDDKKCLEKAEKAAERKVAKRKRKLPARPAGRGRPGFGQQAPAAVGGSAFVLPSPVVQQTVYPLRRPSMPPVLPRQPGPCFACGEMGHIRSYCPRTSGAPPSEARKWYPPHVCVGNGSSVEVDGDVESGERPSSEGGVQDAGIVCAWEQKPQKVGRQAYPQ